MWTFFLTAATAGARAPGRHAGSSHPLPTTRSVITTSPCTTPLTRDRESRPFLTEPDPFLWAHSMSAAPGRARGAVARGAAVRGARANMAGVVCVPWAVHAVWEVRLGERAPRDNQKRECVWRTGREVSERAEGNHSAVSCTQSTARRPSSPLPLPQRPLLPCAPRRAGPHRAPGLFRRAHAS